MNVGVLKTSSFRASSVNRSMVAAEPSFELRAASRRLRMELERVPLHSHGKVAAETLDTQMSDVAPRAHIVGIGDDLERAGVGGGGGPSVHAVIVGSSGLQRHQ